MSCLGILLLDFVVLSACSSATSVRRQVTKQLYVGRFSGNRCSYTDVYDHVVIPDVFQDARQFCHQLAAVKRHGKWVVINVLCDTVIPFRYDWVSSFGEFGFSEKVALAKLEVDKFRQPMFTPCPTVLINPEGQEISPWYGYVSVIETGLSLVNTGTDLKNAGHQLLYSTDGKWGCIDRKGRERIACIYDLMYPFRGPVTVVRRDGLWGVINRKGWEVIPCRFIGVLFRSSFCDVNTFRDIENQS